MPSVTVWALESDYDKEAAGEFANKLLVYHQIENVFVRRVGKSRFPRSVTNPLKKAVKNYLKEDEYVIFVLDADGPISEQTRHGQSNSLINQVQRVLNDGEFSGQVFLIQARQEIEAWLLIDCLGIFCYFANENPRYRTKTRQDIQDTYQFSRIIRKYQKGDTELIVEVEMGGKGAKEHLEDFTADILLSLNPDMPPKNVKNNKYRESLSPKIAKSVEVSQDTLRRNNSLREFGELLQNCFPN